MTSAAPLMIAVAPNGARKTKQHHPQLPISADELAATAAACLDAGACMIHLHVRNAQLGHTLDPDTYKHATKVIRDHVGPGLIIQITSEAVGLYQPAQQIDAVRQVKPEAVSLAIRELCASEADETAAAEFFAWLHRERISAQYILYSIEDIQRFKQLHARGLIPGDKLTVLLVLGRYTSDQQSDPNELLPLLVEIETEIKVEIEKDYCWWLCAFGATESDCMLKAAELGGHCRVGFENNLLLSDGSIAPDNQALVNQVTGNARKIGRAVASTDTARELLGIG